MDPTTESAVETNPELAIEFLETIAGVVAVPLNRGAPMSEFEYDELGKFIKNRRGDNLELAVPLPASASGMNTLRCPEQNCAPRVFQLGESAASAGSPRSPKARRSPGEAGVTCPYCGHDDEQQSFYHPEDLEAATDLVGWALMRDVSSHFQGLARDFNRRASRGSLFSLSMSVEPDQTPPPFFYRQDLLRHLICDCCTRQYGVYAIGLFCPDCGASNLHVHFGRECELIEQQINLAAGIEGQNRRELAYRVLGNAHEDVVTALETYLKTAYRFIVTRRLPPEEAAQLCSKQAIGNRFQNIKRARELFALLNIDPYRHLEAAAVDTLRVNLEKRHVLGHNLGLIDGAYAQRVETEQIGETVPLVADDIRAFASLARTVIAGLAAQSEFQPHISE